MAPTGNKAKRLSSVNHTTKQFITLYIENKTEFPNQINIKLHKIAQLHPSSNPVETFMRPLGKTMKTDHMIKHKEKDTLEVLLNN